MSNARTWNKLNTIKLIFNLFEDKISKVGKFQFGSSFCAYSSSADTRQGRAVMV